MRVDARAALVMLRNVECNGKSGAAQPAVAPPAFVTLACLSLEELSALDDASGWEAFSERTDSWPDDLKNEMTKAREHRKYVRRHYADRPELELKLAEADCELNRVRQEALERFRIAQFCAGNLKFAQSLWRKYLRSPKNVAGGKLSTSDSARLAWLLAIDGRAREREAYWQTYWKPVLDLRENIRSVTIGWVRRDHPNFPEKPTGQQLVDHLALRLDKVGHSNSRAIADSW